MKIYVYVYSHTDIDIVLKRIKAQMYGGCCSMAAMKTWGKEQG